MLRTLERRTHDRDTLERAVVRRTLPALPNGPPRLPRPDTPNTPERSRTAAITGHPATDGGVPHASIPENGCPRLHLPRLAVGDG